MAKSSEIAAAVLARPPKDEWDYMEDRGDTGQRTIDPCGQAV